MLKRVLLGIWVTGLCLVAVCGWSQEAAPERPSWEQPAETRDEGGETPSAQAIYEQAKQKELEGDPFVAYQLYTAVVSAYPDSEWAALAAERLAVLQDSLYEAPSAGTTILSLLFSIASLVFYVLILTAVLGFLGYRAGWFWQWALLAAVTDRVNSAFTRFGGRKRLARELQARKVNPRDGRARHSLGVMYFQQGRYDLALAELEEAVALDPDRVDAQYHLGATYLKLNRAADAIAPLEMVVARKPQHGGDALVRLAEAKLALGEAEEAEGLCREAARKTSTDPESRLWLALALDAQGKPDGVPALLEEAVRLGRAYRGTRRREARAAARKARSYMRSRRA